MLTIKYKLNFRTLSEVLALMILILPITAYARGYGGGNRVGNGGDGRMAPSGRAQVLAPAQRSAPSVRRESAPSAPRQNADFGNLRGAERFNSNQQSNAPAMRFNDRQPNMENRAANAQRFNFDFNARPSQITSSDNRQMRQNFNNRVWARNEPAPIRVDNRLSDSSVAHAGKIISPQNPPTPPAERLVNQGTMRSDSGERTRNDSSVWRRANPQVNTDNNRTAVTRTGDSGWHRGDNRTATFNRDTHSQPAPAWNRNNVSLRVVNNVPSAVTARRTAFSRGSTGFSGRGDHRGRFIDIPRNDFAFFGRHHHFIHHRIIDHDFFYLAFSDFGPWCTYYPVYPYYHRSYIFVNPCGYWPGDYSYMRYYWYGCYPYSWNGYNPVPYEYGTDTTNYYTYNYYGTDTTGPAQAPAMSEMSNYAPQQPAPATSADQYFDDGVKAFGNDDFKTAVTKFALANQISTNDKVLPFAYSQAFLATGDYKSAAQVLRAAVAKVNPVAEGVFYPRGLYASDDTLLQQVEDLSSTANQNVQDSDLQVLLGYQYLGLGELDKAAEPLRNASMNSMNGPTANALLQLLDKLQAAEEQEKAKPPSTPPMETPAESK